MDAILFVFTFITILAGVSIILYRLKVSPVFIWTHALIGSVCLCLAVMEADFRVTTSIPYLVVLWGVTMVFVVLMPIFLYVSFKLEKRDIWSWKEGAFLLLLGVGCALFYGVLEDFGCFIIWGVSETFNPTYAYWHAWIGNFMPWVYLLGIPGLILTIIALWWSTRVVESTTQIHRRTIVILSDSESPKKKN